MYKCKICGKKYNDLACLYNHIESKHADMIPQDMTVQQFYYYMKTGKRNGNCVMCKQPTSWNMNTNKYNRFCGNPRCKEEYVKIMKSRMIAKYGKAHLLNDPNKQREMLANRSISGTYEWSDGKHTTTYTGSYELDFLKTLDNFFDWDPTDISMPSPHTYTYEYEGQQKFYIPDVFIHSLDLEIEIKDGGDNPNNHHKIQDVDKVKEKLKDDVLTSQRSFHYVKITNKNYENFFEFLNEAKKGFEKYGDDKKMPRIFKTEDIRTKGDIRPKLVKESQEIIEEGLAKEVTDGLHNFNNKSFRELDLFLSLRYNRVKDSPKELESFLKRLVKSAKFEDDIRYIRELVGKSDTHYHNLLKKNPELQDEYNKYYKWIKGDMEKDIDKKYKKNKIRENCNVIEESLILSKDNIELNLDKFGGSNNILYITGLGGSGKSTIISEYVKKYNAEALEFDAITSALIRGLENLNRNKIHPVILEYLETQNPNKLNGFNDPNFNTESVKFLDWFENKVLGDGKLYIIEGMQIFLCFEPERFINKPMIIMGTSVIKSMHRSVLRTYKRSNGDIARTFKFFLNTLKRSKLFIKNDKQISELINTLTETIDEGLELDDILIESSISMTQLNLYLQNEYEEEMRHYLATYKEYYQKMQKEKPHAVKHLNEDIKRAIIYIDGLADKGVENNLVQFAREELGSIVEIPKRGKAVKIHESTNTMNVKLLYYGNGRQPFGFNDTKSQFVINENYTIYRDKIGNHCEIKPLPGDEKDKTILEFTIVFNGEINVEEALKNYFETGITINNLFSLRDNEFKFIKEACLKLFGEYPKEINKK